MNDDLLNDIAKMIRRLLCLLGFHEWIKLPRDYKVALDWECWKIIDFDNYDEDSLFKCKHCGKVKEVEND